MRKDDPDSIEKWLERHNDWKTKLVVLAIILLAAIGLVTILNIISPCEPKNGCDPNETSYNQYE